MIYTMNIHVTKINAFAPSFSGGNPAGVVIHPPEHLRDEQMKRICQQLSVSETAFVFPSDKADYTLRFFSPETEVALCGHATIAAFHKIAWSQMQPSESSVTLTQQTNAGILPVHLYFSDGKCTRVMMTQATPQVEQLSLDYDVIATALGVTSDQIDTSLPPQRVSTGLFTLPVCISSLQVLRRITPDYQLVKKICNQQGVGSMHVFSFETIETDSVYHARNFAPVYGINEDPVTGTANGATCWYLRVNNIITGSNFMCEQGDVLNRSGRVLVAINDNHVKVGGQAKQVAEYDIEVD